MKNVVDLNSFRAKKALRGDRRTGIHETFWPSAGVPSETSRAGAFTSEEQNDPDLAARIERIKSSIQRINDLMSQLRDTSKPK